MTTHKILLNVAVSLDGFIEDAQGGFDWCFTDQDYGMTEFLARCDSIIFGRKSYEVLLQYEQNPYPDKQKYLFSNTITSAVGNTIVLKGNVQEALTLIQQRSSGDSWFFGGGSLLRDFMQHRLIDELHLSIHPVLLGGGTPLFSGLLERYWWQLSESKTYATGLVQLIYQRKI